MNEWKPWAGGKQPEITKGRRVCFQERSGGNYGPFDAERLRWEHRDGGTGVCDIVAYRLADETPADIIQEVSASETDPNGVDQHAPGAKLDAGKVMPWLCIGGFANAIGAVAEVTTKGAIKYTPNGWAQVKDGEQRYMEAFGRHLLALGRGERVDTDTGCLHKAQMIWNLMASLELELRQAATS